MATGCSGRPTCGIVVHSKRERRVPRRPARCRSITQVDRPLIDPFESRPPVRSNTSPYRRRLRASNSRDLSFAKLSAPSFPCDDNRSSGSVVAVVLEWSRTSTPLVPHGLRQLSYISDVSPITYGSVALTEVHQSLTNAIVYSVAVCR